MKPDLYTKAVLTVIAFMLVMIGCHQYLSPTATAQAAGQFDGVAFSADGGEFAVFDSRTGDIWEYHRNGMIDTHIRIPKLGQPAVAGGR
jgi:hypothetical protein